MTSRHHPDPRLPAGTWDIDPVHSDISFTVRHMMVSKVRGRFGTFSGRDRHRRRTSPTRRSP